MVSTVSKRIAGEGFGLGVQGALVLALPNIAGHCSMRGKNMGTLRIYALYSSPNFSIMVFSSLRESR